MKSNIDQLNYRINRKFVCRITVKQGEARCTSANRLFQLTERLFQEGFDK